MTAEVKLTKGKVALVDSKDLQLVHRYKWHAVLNHGRWYAYTQIDGKRVAMHRLLMNPPDDKKVYHRNGNSLDNTRANLCFGAGSRQTTDVTTAKLKPIKQYKGVYCTEEGDNICAIIFFEGKERLVGNYCTPDQAARGYDEGATRLFGDAADLNFPRQKMAA